MIRLNLLPPAIKEDIAYAKKNASLYQVLIKLIAGFVAMAAIVGVVGYIVYSNQQIASEEKNVSENQLASWKTTESDAKDFSDRLTLVSTIGASRLDWPLIFSEIAKSTPANVKMSSFDFTKNATDRATLSGFAMSNADIGTFRELLSKSSLFNYVDIENTATATDPLDGNLSVLAFRISLNLNLKEAVK